MTIRYRVVLRLFVELYKDASAAKTLGRAHLNDSNLIISFKEDILLMTQGADTFFKNDLKHSPFQAKFFHRYARALLNERHVLYLEQNKRSFRPLLCFLTQGYSKEK